MVLMLLSKSAFYVLNTAGSIYTRAKSFALFLSVFFWLFLTYNLKFRFIYATLLKLKLEIFLLEIYQKLLICVIFCPNAFKIYTQKLKIIKRKFSDN